MSTFFDFIYNLNTEESQNEVLDTIAATKKKEYEPISHFFTDAIQLDFPIIGNVGTDAFGPILGFETTQYRTTSIVRASSADPVKVFAICNGQILIQPQTGDNTKVNLILKPSSSYNPLKIKYFIYRSINKSDLINIDTLKPVDNEDADQPVLLKKMWDKFIAFNQPLYDNGTIPTPPNVFPASLIGYNENDNLDILIDHYFFRNLETNSYQIPNCSIGEHIGNFTGEIGLDIVLDYGDYELTNQEELFKLNLDYARKKQFFFDTATILSPTPIKIKRYKEHIHQFIDAAAFWGSHIECGKIKVVNNTPPEIDSNNDIYTKIVAKFQTKNKIYVYIQGENNRSYNYYETTRKVAFDLYPNPKTFVLYNTHNWPILIKDENIPVDNTNPGFLGYLEYNIDSNIDKSDKCLLIDIISPNNNTSTYPSLEKPNNVNGEKRFTYKIKPNDLKSTANFLFIFCNLKQEFPLSNYFNNLFPVNFKNNFSLPNVEINDLGVWATYDKSQIINLESVLNIGAVIQNKLFFDNGKGQPVSGVTPRKYRRLYMAILKRNTIHEEKYNDINKDSITAGIAKSVKSKDEYSLNLYNDVNFSVYKGNFIDNNNTIHSLALIHENNSFQKNSFFHLGITEEEYNKLIYGQITVPTTPASQYLPLDADNVFFHFEEIPLTNQNIRKFKLGFRFENNSGILTTLFPLTINDVYVYTLDGMYFFSNEYAKFQEFYNEFSINQVHFRPKTIWRGEFGFDWERIGDSGVQGDSLPTVTTPDRRYQNIFGHYYDGTTNVKKDEHAGGIFRNEKSEYISFLNKNYSLYSINNAIYCSSFLSLYPSKDISSSLLPFPKTNSGGNLKCLTEIMINLKISIILVPTSLKLVYEKDFFEITSIVSTETVISNGPDPQYNYLEIVNKSLTLGVNRNIELKIKSLTEFSEDKKIKVISVENGIEKKVGEISIFPNAKVNRKKAKIAFVNCKTNVNGVNKEGLNISNTFNHLLEEKITKYFNQCLIDVTNFEYRNLDLTPTGSDYTSFNSDYVFSPTSPPTGNSPSVNYINPFIPVSSGGVKRIHDDLKIKLFNKFPELQNEYFILFYINEEAYSPVEDFLWGGAAELLQEGQLKRAVVLFYGGIEDSSSTSTNPIPHEASAHEIFHCLENQHPFVNSNIYTTKLSLTDNIMDYSQNNPTNGIEGISLWQYQIYLSRKHNLIFNE